MKNFIPTNEKVTVENYPYGYTLRTTLYDSMEFVPQKGYRHVTQTINPKNGQLNKPKKSTYYMFLIRYYNEDKHIKSTAIDFNVKLEDLQGQAKRVAEIWPLLTTEEREYLIQQYKIFVKVGCISRTTYKGTDKDAAGAELKKIYDYFNAFANIEEKKIKGELKKVITSYNVDSDIFANVPEIDMEKLNAATPEEYNPFGTTRAIIL